MRQAYRELARQWHPEKHSHRSQDLQDRAGRRFERIRKAYEVLGDEAAKQAYDATLLLSEARPLMTGEDRGYSIGNSSSTVKGSKTDSPIGRNSSAHSPLSRWLPSYRQSRSSSDSAAIPSTSIHVNLFDSKFVNADTVKNPL